MQEAKINGSNTIDYFSLRFLFRSLNSEPMVLAIQDWYLQRDCSCHTRSRRRGSLLVFIINRGSEFNNLVSLVPFRIINSATINISRTHPLRFSWKVTPLLLSSSSSDSFISRIWCNLRSSSKTQRGQDSLLSLNCPPTQSSSIVHH